MKRLMLLQQRHLDLLQRDVFNHVLSFFRILKFSPVGCFELAIETCPIMNRKVKGELL